MILSKYLTFGVPIASLLAGVYVGYWTTSNYYKAEQKEVMDKTLEVYKLQQKVDRNIIEEYNINLTTLRESYIKLGKKLNETKLTTTPCTLTPSATLLWNESLVGEGELSKSTRTLTGDTTTDFARAFENKLINDEKCTEIRKKLEAIKQWDKETFE